MPGLKSVCGGTKRIRDVFLYTIKKTGQIRMTLTVEKMATEFKYKNGYKLWIRNVRINDFTPTYGARTTERHLVALASTTFQLIK